MSRNVVLFVQDPDENQVLQIMLESYGYTVVPLVASESSFREVVQYNPAHIVFELPLSCDAQLALISKIRRSNKTYRIPILGYGDRRDREKVKDIQLMGVSEFEERPLSTEVIQRHIKPKREGSKTLHSKEMKIYEGELEDTAKIMSSETSPSERIEIMVKRIGELLAFPFTVAKVLSVTQSDTTGAQDLAKAIELDPVVVSSVLKVANSAFYKGSSSTMGVKDAIVRIGFTETKNIAIAMSVMKLFSDEEKSVGFSREDFWFHSLATAIIAGEMAKRVRYPKPEVAFIGGLMHDFGIILLDEFFPSYLNVTLKDTIKNGESFIHVQLRKWKMTHNDVVARLFREWNMPEEMVDLVKNTYKFRTYENTNDKDMVTLVQVVGMAEVMAKSLSLGRECDEVVDLIPNAILDQYQIMNQLGDRFWSKISEELNMFSSFLGLKKEKLVFTRDIPKSDLQHTVVIIDRSALLLNPYEFHLISQKNQLIRAKTIDKINELEFTPEFVVLHTTEEDGYDEIADFLSIKKRVAEEKDSEEAAEGEDEEKGEEFVPVIIFNDHEFNGDTFEVPAHVAVLKSELDLRVFSFAIESVCLGHPFSMGHEEEPHVPVETITKAEVVDEKTNGVAFAVKTRVVQKAIAVLELYGPVDSTKTKELSSVISALYKKTKLLAIDFTHTTMVKSEVLIMFHNFRNMLRKKGAFVTLFTLNRDVKERLPEKDRFMLFHFADDNELVKCVKLEMDQKQE